MIKFFERVIEQKFRKMVAIEALQFGFMSGKDTKNVIFIACQLQERSTLKRRKSFIVDLEKAFDWVYKEVINNNNNNNNK